MLGAAETDDGFRQAGVHVFGALVRLLTGSEVTDTSSGFRAMRAEVTETVRQEQVQYQTSELLIGALAQGYRVVERPITMRKRMAGRARRATTSSTGCGTRRVILHDLGAGAPAAHELGRAAVPRRWAVPPALRVARFVARRGPRRGDGRRRRPRRAVRPR